MTDAAQAKDEDAPEPASSLQVADASRSDDELDMAFLENLVPFFRGLRNYTRLKVDGLDNIPETGPALIVGNHTGWLGLDYALTALSVYDAHERVVRGMAHGAWFANPPTEKFAKKVGLFKVTKDAMADQLANGNLVMMFPEGEKGAFRPGSDYTLEEFARGFVRVAMQAKCPVIPVAILGGEEANPVGRRIEGYEDLLKMRGGLPIPKNLIPRPVKWRIRFLPAVDFSKYSQEDASDRELVHGLAEKTRSQLQRELRKMQVERGNPWI